jgi:hypothetical protein
VNGFESFGSLVVDGVAFLASPEMVEAGVWLLAFVLAWSGVAKIRRPALAAIAMVDFRVVGRPLPALGLGLGLVEVGLALGLALRVQPVVVATLASLLLLSFSFVIARSLLAGGRFPCHCFGDGDSADISAVTLVRAAALASLAIAVAIASFRSGTALELSQAEATAATSGLATLATVVLLAAIARLVQLGRRTLVSLEVRAFPADERAPTS